MQTLLSALFDAAPLPMVLCDPTDGSMRLANRRAAELFIAGRQVNACFLHDILGAAASGEFLRRLAVSGGFIDDFEALLQTPYGECFPGVLSGQIMSIKNTRLVLIGLNDITDRKALEDMLRRFFEAGPLAMLLFQLRDSRVTRINRRASELFGISATTDQHTLDDYLGEEAAQEFLMRLAGGGFVESFEAQLTTDYGEFFWALISGQIIEIEGERCVLAGVTDITDRKSAEEGLAAAKHLAEEATRSKSMFLATMSHEIRTPMNGVLGMLEMLGRSRLDGEQREMVEVIGQSASTLLTIIDDILDMSKIEAGKLQLDYIPLGLSNLVEIAAQLTAPRAREKDIELAWWVAPDLPEQVRCDPVRLRQILLNLLSNAVKFTERGRVILRVTRTSVGLVRFEVNDTGIGLAPDQAAKLFSDYAQAESSTTRRFGGTGLGLSISRRLTEMMGGKIGVASELGQGSCFWFELPLEATEEQPPPPPQDLAGLTILIVDDLDESRETMAVALRDRGARVIVARERIEAALVVDPGHPPDFALIDLPTTIEALDDPLTRLIGHDRVLMTLPTGHPDAAAYCEQNGFLPPLLKPVRGGVLARTICSALGRAVTETAEAPTSLRGPAQQLSPEQALAAGRLVLVAEDNAVNRLVVSKQLTELGHSFEIVPDGEAAWQRLKQKPFGLLLTDCSMPVLDGYDLTRRIRAAEAEEGRPRLPVVALTANALEGEAEKCRAVGFDDYLSKPVVLSQLAVCLDQWLPGIAVADDVPASAPSGPAANSLIDIDQFAQIVGSNDRAMIAEVLAYFIETFETTLAAVRAALETRDRQTLSLTAHAAKGAARSACLPVLTGFLQEIEDRAMTREPYAKLGRRLDDAENAFRDVKAIIQSGSY